MREVVIWKPVGQKVGGAHVVQDRFGCTFMGFATKHIPGSVYDAALLFSKGKELGPLFCQIVRIAPHEEIRAAIRRSETPRRQINRKLHWYEIKAD